MLIVNSRFYGAVKGMLHTNYLACLLSVLFECIVRPLRGLSQSTNKSFSSLMMKYFPVKMAKVINMRKKGSVCLPRIPSYTALISSLSHTS